MSQYSASLVNIDEIWLKGKNRKWYTDQLRNQIIHLLNVYGDEKAELVQEGPKFFLVAPDNLKDETIQALSRVAGIQSLQPCRTTENDVDQIKAATQAEVESLLKARTSNTAEPLRFRVETKRSNKQFPLTSMELSRQVGGYLLAHVDGLKADMTNPELTISLRILDRGAFIATKKIFGMGGVPVRSSGKAVTLLSGGFDSPAATYMMFRRGLEQIMAFFHADPFVSEDAVDKVKRIAAQLALFQPKTKLYIVPFGKLQTKIGETAREEYRTLLFRQYMVRVSEIIARRESAKALVMGDSLAQVSSQTLENISILDRTSKLPIFRPLIGLNKHEILNTAKKAGTHDISIEPQDDACSMFAPKHPVIRGHQAYAEHYFEENPLTDEMHDAVRAARIIKYNVKGEELRSSPSGKSDLFDLSDV